MLTFIIHYWVEELCGIIAIGLGLACKKIWKMYQTEKQLREEELSESLKNEIQKAMKKEDNKLKASIEKNSRDLEIIKHGLLSIHKKMFYQECYRLLEPSYQFTVEEFHELTKEHEVYNALGGNHKGDELFKLVQEKAKEIFSGK